MFIDLGTFNRGTDW